MPFLPFYPRKKKIKPEKYKWNIPDSLDCQSENVIYLVQCQKEKCKENRYVGETKKFST